MKKVVEVTKRMQRDSIQQSYMIDRNKLSREPPKLLN